MGHKGPAATIRRPLQREALRAGVVRGPPRPRLPWVPSPPPSPTVTAATADTAATGAAPRRCAAARKFQRGRGRQRRRDPVCARARKRDLSNLCRRDSNSTSQLRCCWAARALSSRCHRDSNSASRLRCSMGNTRAHWAAVGRGCALGRVCESANLESPRCLAAARRRLPWSSPRPAAQRLAKTRPTRPVRPPSNRLLRGLCRVPHRPGLCKEADGGRAEGCKRVLGGAAAVYSGLSAELTAGKH